MFGCAVYNLIAEFTTKARKNLELAPITLENSLLQLAMRSATFASRVERIHHFQADEVKDIKWCAKFLLVYYLL